MLIIDDISYTYKEIPVIKNLSRVYEKGNIFGLVGANGSGKTTFLKCILGMNMIDKGKIYDDTMSNFRVSLSYIPAEISFYPKITGYEFLSFAIRKSEKRKNALWDIEFWNEIFKLPLNAYAENYSTGMKKKLLLLAIILKQERIVILDEPFSGLDSETSQLLIMILNEMKKKRDRTILVASHDLQFLKNTCDYIDVLNNGLIVNSFAEDTFESIQAFLFELASNKILSSLAEKI